MKFNNKILLGLIYITLIYAADNGPTLINETNCSISINIEKTCAGTVIGKHNIGKNETYKIKDTYENDSIEYNSKFCLTLKPSCQDTLMQNIQTISPYFHEKCIMSYKDSGDGIKKIYLSQECSQPNN
ncbi:MAG: hypothetical protein HON55_00335 [Legionellales bacterium]|nr:hypothetical protein [Legionellales bacterium]